MRYCPSCKIKVEGSHKQCPLCQNGLSGDAENNVYPSGKSFRKKSQLYKIQLFVLIALMLVSIVLDFVLDIRGGFHWSIIVATWVIGGEFTLNRLIHKHNNISYITAICGAHLAILIFITFLLIGYSDLYFAWIMPAIAIVCEIFSFVLMMSDKSQNAMIYLLGNSFIDVVLAIIYLSVWREKNILWLCVLLVSVICVIGAVIFKEKRVVSELHKRFHI